MRHPEESDSAGEEAGWRFPGLGRGMESLLNGVLQIEKRPEGGWLYKVRMHFTPLKWLRW